MRSVHIAFNALDANEIEVTSAVDVVFNLRSKGVAATIVAPSAMHARIVSEADSYKISDIIHIRSEMDWQVHSADFVVRLGRLQGSSSGIEPGWIYLGDEHTNGYVLALRLKTVLETIIDLKRSSSVDRAAH
jgi:hypothetical protein